MTMLRCGYIRTVSMFSRDTKVPISPSHVKSMVFGLSYFLLLLLVAVLPSNAQSNDLHLGPVTFAGYNNYVYRDNVTAVQLVVSENASPSPARFILAFPRGNTGIATYFVPTTPSTPLAIALDSETLTSVSSSDNQIGISGNLLMSSDITFGVTLIGSIRTVRDYTEGSGTMHEIFNYTLGPFNSTSVSLIRHWINGTTVQYLNYDVIENFNLSVIPSQNATLPPNITFTRPDSTKNGTLRFTSTFNYTNTTEEFVGLGRSDLFLTSDSTNTSRPSVLETTLQAIQGPGGPSVDQASFLSYQDVFLAGGWRFLTYFGRDTMLALRLLLPTFTAEASEAILRAVIERASSTGTLCHEETVGDYASFINIQNNQSYLGGTSSCSYIMVDTDFLLLPVLADYFLTMPQGSGRATAFLAQNSTLAFNSGTLQQLLLLNVNHIMNLTQAFTRHQNYKNLVRIRDPLVGDWRDSTTGLGYGQFPFDVNVALAPAALRAIAKLSDAGILPANYSAPATKAADIWDASASTFFEIPISSKNAARRLNNYVSQANLTDALLYGAGSLNSSASASNTSASGFSDSNQIIGGTPRKNSVFYALSIKDSGERVEVLHSDLGFVLEYSTNVPESVLEAVVEALQPYPRGLLTNVGMVVANAAYDSNGTDIQTFSNVQYHGAVSWSWQQGIMAQGIARQLNLCGLSNTSLVAAPANTGSPSWCSNTKLTSALMQAQTRLWDSIAGAAPVLFSEVWSPVYNHTTNLFSIGDLGAISPSGTEGDAIQLWSYGFLAIVDPRTGKPVAAGFSSDSSSASGG